MHKLDPIERLPDGTLFRLTPGQLRSVRGLPAPLRESNPALPIFDKARDYAILRSSFISISFAPKPDFVIFRPLELSRTTGGHPASDSSAAIMLPLSPFSEPLWGIGPKIPLFKYSCGSLLAFCPPPIDKPQQATFACWGHSFLVQRHISINLRIFVIIHRFHSSRILRREY